MQQLSRSCCSSPMTHCIVKNASTAMQQLSPPTAAAAAAAVTSGVRHTRCFSFSSLSSSPAAVTPRASFHTAALTVPSSATGVASGGGGGGGGCSLSLSLHSLTGGARPRSSSDGGCFLVPAASFTSSSAILQHSASTSAGCTLSPGGASGGGGGPILRASTRSRFHSLASLHYDEEDDGNMMMGAQSHWRACVLDAEVEQHGGSYGDIVLDSIEHDTIINSSGAAPVRFAIEWRGDTQATGAVVAGVAPAAFSSSAPAAATVAASSSSSSASTSAAAASSASSAGVAATLVSAHRWIESDVSKLSVARGAVWQKPDENNVPDVPCPLAL